MHLMPLRAPNLLAAGGGLDSAEYVARIQTTNCTASLEPDGSLLIRGTAASRYTSMVLKLPPIPVPQGDLFVSFEVRAVDPLTDFPSSDGIPRMLMIHADGGETTNDGTRRSKARYADTMCLFGMAGYTPQYGYWRDAGKVDGTAGLTLTFEDQGAVRLRRLTAHNAPLMVVRDFEHGVVVVNGSQQLQPLELSRCLPSLEKTKLRRIKADPAAYHDRPGIREMLAHNDGRREDLSSMGIPGLDALFLEKMGP